jgi:hypothetical protein
LRPVLIAQNLRRDIFILKSFVHSRNGCGLQYSVIDVSRTVVINNWIPLYTNNSPRVRSKPGHVAEHTIISCITGMYSFCSIMPGLSFSNCVGVHGPLYKPLENTLGVKYCDYDPNWMETKEELPIGCNPSSVLEAPTLASWSLSYSSGIEVELGIISSSSIEAISSSKLWETIFCVAFFDPFDSQGYYHCHQMLMQFSYLGISNHLAVHWYILPPILDMIRNRNVLYGDLIASFLYGFIWNFL